MHDIAPSDQRSSAPSWLRYEPNELRFGTSGLRGRVTDMTDLEVYINTRGFLDYLQQIGDARPTEAIALAEDLRATDPASGLESSPRIARAVARAARDAGFEVVHYGRVPTPALAYQAGRSDPAAGTSAMPCVMVTGSHIPADRNGVKFYKKRGEVLKADEDGIIAAVSEVRRAVYAKSAEESIFDADGMLAAAPRQEPVDESAEQAYGDRYASLFAKRRPLAGKRVVVYQHSAVGRDLLMRLLLAMGAEAIPVDRTDTFVSVDTEDVTSADAARFRGYAQTYHPDAIVSTDGDSDRPLVVDERGRFHRGDVLGVITAEFIGARFAAVPISSSDAIDRHVARRAAGPSAPSLELRKTKIGSPYVIRAMLDAVDRGTDRVVGWEANGGFLTATDFAVGDGILTALTTRDAVLPILAVLIRAAERGVAVSTLFDELPARATAAGLLDAFPAATSRAILARLAVGDAEVAEVEFTAQGVTAVRAGESGGGVVSCGAELAASARACRDRLARHFSPAEGFGAVRRVNFVDGVRVLFEGGDIAHLRPSGNAPQLRIYAVSDTQQRADQIVARAIEEPNGWLRQMERELGGTG